MASSGTKRPYADDAASASGRSDRSHDERRAKPKDWRDAFLEDSPRRRDKSRERRYDQDKDRDHYRRRDDGADRSSRGHRDRNERERYDDRDHVRDRDTRRDGDRTGRDYRDRDRERERDHREHDRGDNSRRHGDRSDRHRDDRNDRRRNHQDREEGELEPSPPKPTTSLPVTSPSRALGDRTKPGNAPQRMPPAGPRASYQPLSVPAHSRSSSFQNRPQSLGNMFDAPAPVEKEEEPEESMTVLEEERDSEKILEERRRKREEIMAKFKANGGRPAVTTPNPDTKDLHEPGTGAESVTSAGFKTGVRTGLTSTGATPLLKQLGTRSTYTMPAVALSQTPVIGHEPSLAPTPMGHDFDLSKQVESVGAAAIPSETKEEGVGAEMMISAADYDPTREAMVDQEKRRKDMEAIKVEPKDVADGVGEPVTIDDKAVVEDEYEEVEIEEEDEDEELDMFAAFGDETREKKKRKVVVRRLKNGAKAGETKPQIIKKPASTIAPEMLDNADDTEGYYRITPGEIVDDGRYQVTITLGKGMFSAVVKAKVLKAVNQERRQDVVGREVAIKVMRSQESMYVAGRKEAQILGKLNEADPEDKKHIVRMEHTFEHRGHFCIVTESLSMNLRDVIKRFGKDVGLNMRAVRAYAHQMLLALSLMRKCSIVHADIKPDNILVSENKATLKVCDLGSAAEITEGEITPYLVSRFYRAPEIILGLPYDSAIDMWSIGCTLYELYTGKILFPGRSNNHMLLLQMELKGKLNHRMIKKASFGTMHFDENLNFISIEREKITGQDVAKTLVISKATRDLRSRLLPPSSVQLKMKDEELKQLLSFVDLLEKCLQLDPARRLTPRDALVHPFLAG